MQPGRVGSLRASTFWPCACSGERYCAVPITALRLGHRRVGVGDGAGDAGVSHDELSAPIIVRRRCRQWTMPIRCR